MADYHRRSSPMPTIRLSRPLPALPISLDDLRAQSVAQIIIVPYHDDPSLDIEHSPKSPPPESLPPSYEPMYDYLRSHQRPAHLHPPVSQPFHMVPHIESEGPYRDEPFVITIDQAQNISQPPPPSYEELYIEDRDRRRLEDLVTDIDGGAVPAEEICKFVFAMLLTALTIAAVGLAFHWGKLGCRGPNC